MQQNIVKYPAYVTPTMSHGKLFSEATQLETPIFQRQLGFYRSRRCCSSLSLSLRVCVVFSHTHAQPHHSQEITESEGSLLNRIGYKIAYESWHQPLSYNCNRIVVEQMIHIHTPNHRGRFFCFFLTNWLCLFCRSPI